ncbi:MAG: hypothetical protein JSV66_11335, partial [Trueperaceae bacterium]
VNPYGREVEGVPSNTGRGIALRGGFFNSSYYLRSANRNRGSPVHEIINIGFRGARPPTDF